jgi:hypothetical protein
MTKTRISQRKKRKTSSRGTSSKQIATKNAKSTGGEPIQGSEERYSDDVYEMRKRQKMRLKLEDGKLLIMLPQISPPHRSRSGKSYLVATSGGVKRTRLLVEGLPVYVTATAFVYGYGEPAEPPVRWLPLIDWPEIDEDRDKTDEEKEEEKEEEEMWKEWETIPLLE